MSEELRFSVVVPTRDRPRSLALCLAALERQEGCGAFEIVVVDDGSADAGEVAALVAEHSRARLVRTAPAGSASARNRGVQDARAPLVFLVDDDCEPRAGWAAALLGVLGSGADVAAGRCANLDASDALAEATQTVLDQLTFRTLRSGGGLGFTPTYNLACLRDLLLEVPFDESYVNSGADRDWCARLAEGGRSIVLASEAVADHRQTLDLRSFLDKHRAYGRGSARFHLEQRVGLERPRFYLGLVRAGFRKGARVGLAVCLAQLATAAGFATEILSRRRA
jgi:glycosyltransferase involved in cell wall biosynthesis